MEITPRLNVPYLTANQAQKHVTLNEALRDLDVYVQATALSRARTAPPPDSAPGDAYILSDQGEGAWSGFEEGQLVANQDGAWREMQMPDGMRVYVDDENTLLVRKGGAWRDALSGAAMFDRVGVNAEADGDTRFALRSNYALFSNDSDVSGSTYLTVNKATEADTASLLFQTNFGGRAECGLAGTNDFSVKVSADGLSWQDPLKIDTGSGYIGLNGADPSPSIPLVLSDTRPGYAIACSITNPNDPGAGATRLQIENDAAGFMLQAYGTGAPGALSAAASIVATKGAGGLTLGASTGDVTVWASNQFNTPQVRVSANEVSMGTSLRLKTAVVAQLPAPGEIGSLIFVTDHGVHGALAFSDGSAWRRVEDSGLIS